jgi:hypothetical protein
VGIFSSRTFGATATRSGSRSGTFSGQYEWAAAYTHSRTISNAVVDANSGYPFSVRDQTG